MKQLFIIILVICFLISSGCTSKNNKNENTVSELSDIISIEQELTTTSQVESSNVGNIPTNDERSDITSHIESVSTEDNTPKDNINSEYAINTSASEIASSNEADVGDNTSSLNSTITSSDSNDGQSQKATAADAKVVAEKMVEHINAYRVDEGVPIANVLPGLTKYAEYRSQQLITNFAHDTSDERTAATALQYGQYIDPSQFGVTGEPYYTVNAREAIAKTDYGGTVDNVAKRLAQLVQKSPSHWSYVGSEEYIYIGIGVTFEKGIWYCDISVSIVNTDN